MKFLSIGIIAAIIWIIVWIPYYDKRRSAKALVRVAGIARSGENDSDVIQILSEASDHPPMVSASPEGCTVNMFSVRVPSVIFCAVLPVVPAYGGYTVVVEVHSRDGVVAQTKIYKQGE